MSSSPLNRCAHVNGCSNRVPWNACSSVQRPACLRRSISLFELVRRDVAGELLYDRERTIAWRIAVIPHSGDIPIVFVVDDTVVRESLESA